MNFRFGLGQTSNNPPPVQLDEIKTTNGTNQGQVPVPQVKKEKGMFEFTEYPRVQLALRGYCSIAALFMMAAAVYSFTGPKDCSPAYFFLLDAWLV
jgi:hypothetical protein